MRVLGRTARRAGRGRPRLYFSFVSFLGHLSAFPLSGGRGEQVIGLPRYPFGRNHSLAKNNQRIPHTKYYHCPTFIRFGKERGMRAEAWSLRGGVTAFDAELSALVRGIELCYLQASPGAEFRIFTDSQAAMRRIQDDRPGPGQQMAIRGVIGATKTYQRGANISISWVPGHAGVIGNEVADQWAVDAATREMKASKGRDTGPAALRPDRMVSRAFLKATLKKEAVRAWRDEIIQRGRGGRPYRIPGEGEVPRIPKSLQGTSRELASRFF